MAVSPLGFPFPPIYPEQGVVEACNLEPQTDTHKKSSKKDLLSLPKGAGKGWPDGIRFLTEPALLHLKTSRVSFPPPLLHFLGSHSSTYSKSFTGWNDPSHFILLLQSCFKLF